MRTKTLLLLLSLAAGPLFSQKLTFEAFVGGHHDFIPDATKSAEGEFQSLRIINDSQAVRTYVLQRYSLREQYSAQPGYQFGTRTVWHLDQRTELMTGFTVAFRKFTRTPELPMVTTLSTRTTTDTIALSLGGGSGIPFVYDNQYSDLGINENPPYTLFHLSIPLELRYTVMPWLRLKAGVYISTPVYSKRHIEDYNIEQEVKNGVRHYRYVKTEYDDTAGTHLRRLVDGLSGSAEFPLTKRLHLEVGVQKDMRSIMQAPPGPLNEHPFSGGLGTYAARPLSVFLRAGYRLL